MTTIQGLHATIKMQDQQIKQLTEENARLRAALSVICNASQAAARFDDLRQVAYEALKGETNAN